MEKKEIERQQIIDWLSRQENLEHLSLKEQLEISLAAEEYMEKVTCIVVKKMCCDKSSTFLFKL